MSEIFKANVNPLSSHKLRYPALRIVFCGVNSPNPMKQLSLHLLREGYCIQLRFARSLTSPDTQTKQRLDNDCCKYYLQ